MKTYSIMRDGRLFGGFTEGDPARKDGEVINDETMLQEFKDCVRHWAHKRRGNRYQWELRITLQQ